ncbi:MAG: N,N-dimethylformamidase beta subunit family domain-containing protein [Acidimicrobiales bacterium]
MSPSKRLVSYCDPISVGPGDEVRFMVSSHDDDPFDAQLVRIVCGDITPDGHGYTEVACDASVNGRYDGRHQPIAQGSYGVVPPNPMLSDLSGLSVEVSVYPTLHGGVRTLLSSWGSGGGFALELRDGVPQLVVGDGAGGSFELCAEHALTLHRWAKLTGTYDPASNQIGLTIEPLVVAPGDVLTALPWSGSLSVGMPATVATEGPLLFAAREIDGVRDQHFDGRLDACALGSEPDTTPDTRWDFSRDIGTDRITDTGPHGLHGIVRQLPTRGIPGANWTGEVHNWTVDPSHYGAIHFHADDLADAEWEPACTFTIPDDLASGVYALRSSTGDSEDHAVFFVLASPDRPHADVAWLAPTMTYRAYANTRLVVSPGSVFGSRAPMEVANDRYLAEHRECGLSIYDIHADRHGVAHSSHLRPIMNMKPKGGLWSFTADTNVTAWLDQTGVDHDVITDDALHHRGDEILDRYRVIVTGTHPEYWTTRMLDALERWQQSGGRLIVMGGNGFYWRTGVHQSMPAAAEVRRAEDGTRAWIAEPGEYVMETTGELGGIWRRLGRPPNRVSGAGFSAQGFQTSGYFRRSDAWDDPRVAFAVEGLSGRDIFGDHGTIGGGAAGHEIDRYDQRLGSPAHAIVLASSEGIGADMLLVKEEHLATGAPIPGCEARADVVFYETPNGGAVFNTASITWAASLATNGYDNDVAKLTTNVLRRFADPEPIPAPVGVTEPRGVPRGRTAPTSVIAGTNHGND